MNNRSNTTFTELEKRLRQSAPPCAPVHIARVERVCASLNDLPPTGASHASHPAFGLFARRVAALVLIVLTAVLAPRVVMRHPQKPPLLPFSANSLLDGLNALHIPQRMTGPLATESENLLTDLVTLTAVVNERTFAILF
ncbi:MAG TPA: hypothetical protein P5026_06405 [Kiritimatiellia bacterium]|nr:hypothetical protein [Kiritimatiellia bacterium]HRU70777.1 hypothetical protein [Kiritimatiellia bacterium]